MLTETTSFTEKRTLGRTGLQVGRFGISSSYGAPTEAFEEAFDRGCNYFNWGAFIRGRSKAMRRAIANITANGKRDELVVGMLTYAHNAFLTELFLKKGLRAAGLEYTDVLIIGYYSKRPPQSVIDGALRLKEKGLVRFLGLTSHNRKLFPELAKEGIFDVFHVRYNAAHRGAETETFPLLPDEDRPGIVSFTATAWKRLLKSKKLPAGEPPLNASDCYRFALSHPDVDVCMMGAANLEQMRANLAVLDMGPLSTEEMERVRWVGDAVYIR